MHGAIRNRLEELLSGKQVQERDIVPHLVECAECAHELDTMKEHQALLSTLRISDDTGPAPGFYARVMQRIEEAGVPSIWSVFTDTPFGKRLAYASLALFLVLGTWVVSVETADGHFGSADTQIEESVSGMPLTGDQAHQRDVVLVNLASYSPDAVQ